MVAGHRSAEPGATVALNHLGLEPLIDLGLRLGEGTGAALALPIVAAALAILSDMATFDGAGVTDTGA
jgi:nicotinate-nucleotide--dimethylbenzimidazole phosphoribosyltransferase